MIDVNVNISSIIMYCDDSIDRINLGRGYTIKKIYFDDLPFKDKVTNGSGNLDISYMGSRLHDDTGLYFMCIDKTDTYQIEGSKFTDEKKTLTYNDVMCNEELESYKEQEVTYLYNVFSLLRLFKSGNIGMKSIFLEHSFVALGFFKNAMSHTSNNESRNIVDTRIFSLQPNEVLDCNHFLSINIGQLYNFLKPNIDEFVWGLEQIDIPTGFEQFTTTLEMTLLEKNQKGKKQALANRVAVYLENQPNKIQQLQSDMLNFYRFRSESLHEGDGSNITKAELALMEEIVRKVLCKLLAHCKIELAASPTKSFATIKSELIDSLKTIVITNKAYGSLL